MKPYPTEETEIFIDNLLVRVHWIIEIIVVERPCAMGVWIPDFQVKNHSLLAGGQNGTLVRHILGIRLRHSHLCRLRQPCFCLPWDGFLPVLELR